MKLERYLHEKIAMTGERRADSILKKLEQWKADLRRMTKLYKSLKTEDTPKAIKEFNSAHRNFITFRQNWEKWTEQQILIDKKDRIPMDVTPEEKDLVKDVKVKAWQAAMSIGNIFPEAYDYHTRKHTAAPWELDKPRYSKGDTRKNRVLVYQKKFKLAFDAIEKLVKHNSERINVLKDTEQQNVQGINVLVTGMKDDEDPNSKSMKRVKKFINNDLPAALKLIKKEGIKQVLKGLTIELTLTGAASVGVQSGAGGSYDYIKDWLRMYPMGMGSDSIPTIIHELGHRYYYRHMPKRALEAWEKMFHNSSIKITDWHVDEFWNKYVRLNFDGGKLFNKKPVIAAIRSQETNPTTKAVYLYLANRLWTTWDHGERTNAEIEANEKDSLRKRAVDEFIPFEFITDYGATKPEEAFAEAFKLWVGGKKGRLGEWTRAFFKKVVRSGGANIKEETKMNLIEKIDKYIKEGASASDIENYIMDEFSGQSVSKKEIFNMCVAELRAKKYEFQVAFQNLMDDGEIKKMGNKYKIG